MGPTPPQRRYIGMIFECCSIYTRIYINGSRTAYVGRCPRCTRGVEIKIDKRGTSSRFFKASF